jgi:hypothetical protein
MYVASGAYLACSWLHLPPGLQCDRVDGISYHHLAAVRGGSVLLVCSWVPFSFHLYGVGLMFVDQLMFKCVRLWGSKSVIYKEYSKPLPYLFWLLLMPTGSVYEARTRGGRSFLGRTSR